jgi:hypothetical protein
VHIDISSAMYVYVCMFVVCVGGCVFLFLFFQITFRGVAVALVSQIIVRDVLV